MQSPLWSPLIRGAGLEVDVPLVLKDPKAALQPLLRVVPGWNEVRGRGGEMRSHL